MSIDSRILVYLLQFTNFFAGQRVGFIVRITALEKRIASQALIFLLFWAFFIAAPT